MHTETNKKKKSYCSICSCVLGEGIIDEYGIICRPCHNKLNAQLQSACQAEIEKNIRNRAAVYILNDLNDAIHQLRTFHLSILTMDTQYLTADYYTKVLHKIQEGQRRLQAIEKSLTH